MKKTLFFAVALMAAFSAFVFVGCGNTEDDEYYDEEVVEEVVEEVYDEDVIEQDELSGLTEEIEAINDQLPMELADGLFLTTVYYSNGYFVYEAICDEDIYDIDEFLINKSIAKDAIIESLYESLTSQQIASVKRLDLGFAYKYIGDRSKKYCTIRVHSVDL